MNVLSRFVVPERNIFIPPIIKPNTAIAILVFIPPGNNGVKNGK